MLLLLLCLDKVSQVLKEEMPRIEIIDVLLSKSVPLVHPHYLWSGVLFRVLADTIRSIYYNEPSPASTKLYPYPAPENIGSRYLYLLTHLQPTIISVPPGW